MTGDQLYGSRPVKPRVRRTPAQLASVDEAITEAVRADHPVTLRGVYYRVVSAGAVPKTEAGYKLVSRRLLALRRARRVPYSHITDGTRWTFKPTTWTDVDQMLEDAAESYRRALWHDSRTEIHIYSEKDAITGAVNPVTDEWDIPLGIVRGYSSETFTWQVAEQITRALDRGNEVYNYQLGDHDPSGLDAWRSFEERVREFVGLGSMFRRQGRVTFERLAVTPEQIIDMDLPTRPTKGSDTRAANFEDDSVEVDAIPASTLRDIAREAITQHVDHDALEQLRQVEDAERDFLSGLSFDDGGLAKFPIT